MKFQSRTVIEITEHSVKFFQAPLKGNNLLSFFQYINFDILTDEVVINFLSNVQKSKKLLSLKSSEIILIIPRQHILLRYLDLPSEKPEELKVMVELQAAQELPFNREEVVVDFMALDKTAGYTKVLVVAVLGESVLHFIKLLEMSHIKVSKIVPSFIGLWHWYKVHGHSIDGVSVVLDIDSYQSEVCLCDQKRVFASRPTNLGMKEINTKQHDDFLKQLDWTIAGYVKEQLGLSPSQIVLISLSEEKVTDLLTQIQIQYSTPVRLILPLKEISLPTSFVWPQALLEDGSSVTAALGLLCSKTTLPIDLIPPEIKAERFMKESKRQGIHLGIAIIIALLSVGFSLSLNFIQQNKYLSVIEEKTRETQKKVAAINHKVRQINYLKASLNNRIVLIDLIDEIYQLLPKGVVLTNLTLSQEHRLTFQGYTAKVGDVNEMQKAFVTSNRFDNVNLDYVNKRIASDGELNYFKITCHIKLSKGVSDEEVQ